jgi:hypothetical protein
MRAAFSQAGPPEHSSADDGRQCPICQIVLPLRHRVGKLLGVPYSDALDTLEENELRHALDLLGPQENVVVKTKQHKQS